MKGTNIERREFIKLATMGLASAGLWATGCASAEDSPGVDFSFIVVNDTHYKDENCAAYFQAAFKQMTDRHRFDFLLVAGDVTTSGTPGELSAFKGLTDAHVPVPTYCVMGNHDCPGVDRKAWVDTYGMDRINYRFDHKEWTFLGIDTTNRGASSNVVVYPETLAWIRNTLRDVPSTRPIVMFGHHPLGDGVHYQVLNAKEILGLFESHNLKHVFNGHFHGLTEKKSGSVGLTTDRCLSISRGNHDGSKEKGYFLVTVEGEKLSYEFIEFEYAG